MGSMTDYAINLNGLSSDTSYSTEEIRAVRLNIPDVEPIYGAGGDEYLFEDPDIVIFLRQGHGNPMWAAGLAMIAVGNSEALIGKVIRNYETETDASKLQREWRTAGIELIKLGKSMIDDGDSDFLMVAFPQWGPSRHPEGMTHPGYRGLPGSYQW